MAIIAGDFTEITFNHPTLGTGTFFPKAAEDSTLDTGGFRNNDDGSGIDGAGRVIMQKNRVRWSFETSCAMDQVTENDLQKLSDLAESATEADWTFSHVSGTIWQAKGSPVGDVQGNGNAGTFALKVAGGGKMKKQ